MGDHGLKEAVSRRWGFIEFCLNWEGSVGRKRLQDVFGISPQQATNDLNGYNDYAPGNMTYDPRKKKYLPSESFIPRFIEDDPYDYLHHVNATIDGHSKVRSWLGYAYKAAGVSVMKRQISADVLRTILQGIREQRVVTARYIALSLSSDSQEKRIVPQALAFDGHRWHARAFNMERDRFSDYVLSRFESAEAGEQITESVRPDLDWIETIDLHLLPNPELDSDGRRGLEYEYLMENGKLVLEVKKAMLFYYLRQYGFNPLPLDNGRMLNQSSFNLVIENFDEVETCLNRR